jgi:hypothetical protein
VERELEKIDTLRRDQAPVVDPHRDDPAQPSHGPGHAGPAGVLPFAVEA